MTFFRPVRHPLTLALLALAAAACDDGPSGPATAVDEEVAVVVNSVDRSLTVVPVERPDEAYTIGLAPDGSPVTMAVRGGVAVVPMGTLPSAVVVDLATRQVVHTAALPAGSGATGAAFVNDSVALVANSGLNSVSTVNVRSGQVGAPLAVGRFPQGVLAANDTAWVLNAELENFVPVGPGTVSVVTGSPLQVVRTVQLSGTNPSAAVFGADGRIYVLNSGGAEPGTLSVVDRRTGVELSHHEGFGAFPGALAVAPDGMLAVSAFGYGVALWSPVARAWARPPEQAIAPGGVPSATGIGYDEAGRLYALEPECVTASRLHRMQADGTPERVIPVGICPFALAFGRTAAAP